MDANVWLSFPANLLWRRQRNLSETVGRADHIISRRQELHLIALQSRLVSSCFALLTSKKRYAKNSLFVSASSRNIRRPCENLGMYGQAASWASYSKVILTKFWTILRVETRTHAETRLKILDILGAETESIVAGSEIEMNCGWTVGGADFEEDIRDSFISVTSIGVEQCTLSVLVGECSAGFGSEERVNEK